MKGGYSRDPLWASGMRNGASGAVAVCGLYASIGAPIVVDCFAVVVVFWGRRVGWLRRLWMMKFMLRSMVVMVLGSTAKSSI